MKLLMTTAERELPTHPTDPVEIRRLNYQTPAMINHPPIPITELGNHIEMLKANDNMKFSQEYEVLIAFIYLKYNKWLLKNTKFT